ncbi:MULTISPECIES: hypothetical protein [Pseudonocardia]|uniref:VWFA domain-containing protein n=2 Tax=Pseudonocardia TaxID=1847 RepID=A0A1Y2MVA0_PSEAH|nr:MULTISPECIES: hypothetical protein [Pseudonocardia]OSY39114.1 hypothetical protein BG845_03684 [Pseudonocardia autotrophica]TDN71290.1 hypothetical protein C8E95_0317 [Pseudonocardia autotrophica]BBG01963.1 hypothetical protein Pdca_31720 [Pseudonocardia autotrophica]GEC23127.1 hypothetical protein PSA01_01560 [Pseudonocardia saturnea]
MTNPGSTLLAVHLDRSSLLRPLLPALRAGLADLLEAQTGPDEPEVVLSTGNDLTRSLADGTHPPAVPVPAREALAALPAKLRPLDGPDLRTGAHRLLDAVGDQLAARPEAERPGRVVVLLVGEGAVGDTAAVRERIAHQQAAYAWEFVLVDIAGGVVAAGKAQEPEESDAGAASAEDAAGQTSAVAVKQRSGEPAAAARFGIPATATITAGPGRDGVSAAFAAATSFVARARAAAPHEPVEGFSDDERAAADVPDGRPTWKKLLRIA